jgi:hypothetical protein
MIRQKEPKIMNVEITKGLFLSCNNTPRIVIHLGYISTLTPMIIPMTWTQPKISKTHGLDPRPNLVGSVFCQAKYRSNSLKSFWIGLSLRVIIV